MKIKLIGFTDLNYSQDGYFLNYLKNNSKFKIVGEDQDLIILNIWSFKEFNINFFSSNILIFSGENLYYKSPFGLGILRKLNLHTTFLKNYLPKLKIFYKFFKILNKSKKKSNIFWILCNDNKRNNILNFPYFFDTHLEKINQLIEIKKQKLYTKKKNFCAFIVGNSYSKDRIKFFHKLSKYKKVDSFGTVLNNKEFPKDLLKKYACKKNTKNLEKSRTLYNYNSVNQELFQDYKFVICFENAYNDDYITEKLPNVMMANSIGIYRGAKNISEFFNTKSFINYDDYGNYDKMIKKIIELDKDDNKYQEMLNETFFPNNQLPIRVKNAKQDLESFLEKIVQ